MMGSSAFVYSSCLSTVNRMFFIYLAMNVHEVPLNFPFFRRIYNIVDDDPAPREEVFTYAEDLIQKKWPGWVKQSTSSERAVSSMEKGCSRGEKRVSNARMKRELGVRLLHPSYRSGLISIIDQMENPFQCGSSSSW